MIDLQVGLAGPGGKSTRTAMTFGVVTIATDMTLGVMTMI
jgi:hypothetical protein